jgi:hypothetical protein
MIMGDHRLVRHQYLGHDTASEERTGREYHCFEADAVEMECKENT